MSIRRRRRLRLHVNVLQVKQLAQQFNNDISILFDSNEIDFDSRSNAVVWNLRL
jgi:hypothetical protein